MKVKNLLDEAKAITGSDYKTAQLMKLERQNVSNWRNSRSHPDSYAMSRLAEITGRTIQEIMAIVELEKETNAEKRTYWKKIGGIAATILISATLLAQPLQLFPTLYIMLNRIFNGKSKVYPLAAAI